MDPDRLLADLNAEQREAVTADAPRLRILAGAGSGKTRVLTRRIAYRSAVDAVDPRHVLAVTFTRKAAAELRNRLGSMGLRDEIQAGTFHAIAAAQLRQRWAERNVAPPELLDRKVAFLMRHLRRLDRIRAMDLASEIEWAKARMIPPERYAQEATRLRRRVPTILGEVEQVGEMFATYERDRQRARLVDFDDLLRLAARDLRNDPAYAAARRWRNRFLFVDEFQDTNPLQFDLLSQWLDPEVGELTVVGDPNQAIYAWNGADAVYLTELERFHPGCRTVTLVQNYRSTPEILTVANRIIESGGGRPPQLVANRRSGQPPRVFVHPDGEDEAKGIARRIRRHHPGRPWGDHAVLVRTHAQGAVIAEALRAADIPCRTRGDTALLQRPETVEALRQLSRHPGGLEAWLIDLADTVDSAGPPDRAAPADDPTGAAQPGAATEPAAPTQPVDDRAASLIELIRMGREYRGLDPGGTAAGFHTWLGAALRTESGGSGVDAVDIVTFHAAKGLEWPVAHLAGIEAGFCPIHFAETAAERAEELRLFYVACTRAEEELVMSRAERRQFGNRSLRRDPSPYLTEVQAALDLIAGVTDRPRPPTDQVRPPRRRPPGRSGAPIELDADQRERFERLRRWRSEQARAADVPAFVVFNDATLRELAVACPDSQAALLAVSGIGPAKATRFGPALLELLAQG